MQELTNLQALQICKIMLLLLEFKEAYQMGEILFIEVNFKRIY